MANIKKLPLFVRCVIQNFPFIEEDFDALTNYELISKVVEFLNKVITSQNEVIGVANDLQVAFQQLHDYVENYFDNLDVQEEINNKLDAMVEAGTLQEIITTYIQANVAWTFDTVADMKLSTNLVDGSYARTLGFRSLNDGGGALYYITDTGTADEMSVIAVGNLYANIVENKIMSPEQFGAYGDNTHDDTNAIQTSFNTCNRIVFGKARTYKITETVTLNSGFEINGNNSVITGDLAENAPLFEGLNATKGYCTDLKFTGGINTGGFHVTNSDAIIENCSFEQLGLYGVSGFKVVRNCYFYNCCRQTGGDTGQGMIYAGKDGVLYENNEFYALDGDGLDHCIYAGGSQHHDIQILNNKCYALEGCTQGPLLAIYPSIEVPDENYHFNCIVKGNIFDYSKGASSRAGIAMSMQDSIFADNIVYGNGTSVATLYIVHSKRNTISGNKFIGGYINAEFAVDTLFEDNTLKNCNQLGLNGTSETNLIGFVIKNNNFINTQILQRSSRHCSGVIIDGNHFTKLTSVTSGIAMNQSSIASSNVTIKNNIIENASNYGILCRYVTNVNISDNTIINTDTSLTTNKGMSFQYNTDYTGSVVSNNIALGNFLTAFEGSQRIVMNGGIFTNNIGGELGNGMLTAYPENSSSGISNHSAWYIGEMLNLSGTIYISKSVGSGESDWVQISN